jgi:hypothetical protein
MEHFVATQTYEDIYYLPPPGWLPVLSVGFDQALADLLWLRGLVYFGEELTHRGQVTHVFDYAEAMLTLDPDFEAVYHWIGTVGMYRPVEVSVDDVRRSIAFLERGAHRFPEDGEMLWATGASLCFELTPLIEDPEEKRVVNLRGIAYLEAAARLGAGPDWLVFTTTTRLRQLGETERALRHLEEMYSATADPDVRRSIAASLAQLRDAQYALAFEAAHERLEEERLKSYPYVRPTLYPFLGSRPPTAPQSQSAAVVLDDLDR